RTFNPNSKKRQSFRLLGSMYFAGSVFPWISWGTISDEKNPRTIIRHTIRLICLLSLFEHRERLFNRSAHGGIARCFKRGWLELICRLKVGLHLHWPES